MFGKGLFCPFLVNNSVILSISQSLISAHILFTFSLLSVLIEIFFLVFFIKLSFLRGEILSTILSFDTLLLLISFFRIFLSFFLIFEILFIISDFLVFFFSAIFLSFRSFNNLVFAAFIFFFSSLALKRVTFLEFFFLLFFFF